MVFIVKTTCCTLYNYTYTQVRWGGVKVMTRGRHGYAFVGKCAVLIPFGGRCSLMTVLKGRKRSTEKVLHKEYKQVSASKVVVRDGEWDHRGPVAGLRAFKDPLVAANYLRKRLDDHNKTRCQGFRREF